MTFGTNVSSFGKREVHRVWTDRLSSKNVSLSTARGCAMAAACAVLAIVSARTAVVMALGGSLAAPRIAILALAAIATVLALTALWAGLRALRLVLRRGPMLSLDSSRMVLRTLSGHIVLPWDDVSFDFGRLFMKIRVHRSPHGSPAKPEEILIPAFLVRGGKAALQEAVRSVRPDLLASA